MYDYNARWYHPALGRFVSADTIVPEPGNPQGLNRYSYSYENPVLYVDKDGHIPVIPLIIAGVLLVTLTSDVRMPERGMCPHHQCEPLDRYNTTVHYIHSEMVHNAQGPVVEGIQQLHGASKQAAWGAMVAPKSFWDHKPKLEDMLGLYQEQRDYYFPIEGDSEYEYFYDVWSNIHYGYVGMAAGFDPGTLQSGAAVPWVAGTNDAYDILSIQIGIDLWNQYHLDMTVEQLRDAILANRDEYIRIWEEVYRKGSDMKPPPIPRVNGR